MTPLASGGREAWEPMWTDDPTIRIQGDRLDGPNLEAANLSLRGSQRAARPCHKVVGTQSLGHSACEAKRAAQSQGCRGSKACCHSAPDVDRRYRVQVVIKGGCSPTCIAEPPNSRSPAGTNVPAGTLALVRSLLALRCSRD